MQYFPNIFIFLGALNVGVLFKHKNTVVTAVGSQILGILNRKLSKVVGQFPNAYVMMYRLRIGRLGKL